MSVHFLDVIQRTPVESLRAYIGSVSPAASENVDWTAPRPELVTALVEMVLTLDETAQERVLTDVERVAQFLVDEHGRRMLRGVLPASEELLERFDALEDVTACALFVLMRDEDQFEHALSAHYAQRFLNGRDWTGLDFEPGVDPTVREHPSIVDFEVQLRDIFAIGGPIPIVAVERFTLRDPDPGGFGNRTREQFSVYFETPPKLDLIFAGRRKSGLASARRRKVEAQTRWPIEKAELLLDAKDCTLDIVAKGASKAQRRQMAEAFVETILTPGATLAARSRRTLALDQLKRRPNFDVRAGDRVKNVEVTRLALGAPDGGSMATFEFRGRDTKKRAEADLYDRAERAFGRNGILARPGWSVLSAKLRILFEPEKPKARPKSVTFELKAPDRTNLRDQIELHRQIADTLLARWGLYEGEQ